MLAFGTFVRKLDKKNRLVLPASLRKALDANGAEMVLTAGPDNCLRLFTLTAWQRHIEENFRGVDSDPAKRRDLRIITATAARFTLDRIGRILLPQILKDRAGIRNEVIVVGAAQQIELWSPETWEAYLAAAEHKQT